MTPPPERPRPLPDTPDAIARELAATPLLDALRPREREALAECALPCHFSRTTCIFEENQQAEYFHLLLHGLVKICHYTAEGREVVLHLVRPRSLFGETAVLQRSTFPAAAVAVEASRTLRIPGPFFLELLRGNADLAMSLLVSLSLRLRMFTRKLESGARRDASRRLAAWLLHRSHMAPYSPCVRLDISRELLASMLGTARETLSRALTRLGELGAVEVRGRVVRIANASLLQQVADGRVDTG